MFDDELIVRKVGVEGPDHVVAVAIGVGDVVIEFVPGGLGEDDQVQPVPRPALAISGRREQPIDQRLIGDGRPIGHERRDLRRAGGETGQVERQTADQGPTIGLGGGGQSPGLERRQDEPVDRRPRPALVLDLGGRVPAQRLEAPVPRALAKVEGIALPGRLRWPLPLLVRRARNRPGGPHLDPTRQRGDLAVRQLRFRRHLVEVAVVDRVDQQALRGDSWHDRRSALAAGHDRGPRIEPEVALGLLRPVARLTTLDQDRPDLVLEEREGRRVGRRLRGGGRGRGNGPLQGDQARQREEDTTHRPSDHGRVSPPGWWMGRAGQDGWIERGRALAGVPG